MGAITAVPREVVPLVNHSPGFAMRCGSDVLSQADIAGFWGLAGLTAAGGKRSWRFSVPPAPLPLQPANHHLGSWSRGESGRAKPCMLHELSDMVRCY